MPPELKKTITSISEMTCGNCVFGVNKIKDDESLTRCHHFELGYNYDPDEQFCSEGTWRLVVAQNRVSLGCYEVCYDYLTEAE